MKCAYSSNVGAKRKVNQDAYLAATLENNGVKCYVFAVADGLGGHCCGEIASKLAIEYIKENLSTIDNYFNYEEMNHFVNAINKRIIQYGYENVKARGMATTLTLCIIYKDRMAIAHVGDSRAYCINEHGIKRLTKDHSLVQVLIDEGKITELEAISHPQKNVITRALGTDNALEIDLFSYNIIRDDNFLICTDGLYNMVDEQAIYKIVRENSNEEAVKNLINLANANGGNDNITVVIFNFKEEENAHD